jgi:hypothetical protein
MQVSCQLHAQAALPPGKEPSFVTIWIGGWVDPRAGVEAMEKIKVHAPAGDGNLAIQPVTRPYID